MTSRFSFPRVQVIPEVDRASFQVDGVERLAYQFGGGSRPFLFPLTGPSGAVLTRMGHPRPLANEPRKSVWFGHEKLNGVSFWEEQPNSDIQIRHQAVKLYHDGDRFGGMAVDLVWWANGRALLRHELTVVLRPLVADEMVIDLQSHFEAADHPVEFGPSSFGFLGVQLSKTLSEQFGGGSSRNDRGVTGSRRLHGSRGRWLDISGPTSPSQTEGLCCMDHPANPNHPTPWHVGGDGYLGAAFNMESPYGVATDHPLVLRYRLFAHRGSPSTATLDSLWEDFASTGRYDVRDELKTELPRLSSGDFTLGQSSAGRQP